MRTNTCEEMEVTQHADEQEPPETTSLPQPEEAQPETPEQETTAVLSQEPEVIEGEVIELEPPEPAEDCTVPEQKTYWLLIPATILLCLVFLAGPLFLQALTPSATVTLIPVEKTVSLTTAIQVHVRALAPLTLMQATTAPATGKRHQDAMRAAGTITFYNGLLSGQTIAAGTVLTGSDGVEIVMDQTAHIPAGTPPVYGQTTVSAHAVLAGEQGNIPAYDVNTACCAPSVVAKNTSAFTSGSNARDFPVATRTDINTAATSLLVTLSRSEDAALLAQLHPGEELILPACTPHVSSNHKAGEEATQVTITVSETCTGIAYDAHTLFANATQLLTSQATVLLGAGYALIGAIQAAIVPGTVPTPHQGVSSVFVQITGTWAYQITPAMQNAMMRLVAGMHVQQARVTLVQLPGIAGVQISVNGGNHTLPQDPRNVHIIVVYQSAYP